LSLSPQTQSELTQKLEQFPTQICKSQMDVEALRKLRPDVEARLQASRDASKLSKEEDRLLANLDSQIAAYV